MARQLDLFREPLAVAPEPGLDSLDPRFSAITALASRAAYGDAADQIEELLREDIYDIRLISIYFFQAFREGGLAGLAAVVTAAEHVLVTNFEAVGPVKRREETFDRRLAWLFSEVTDTLTYHETKQSPEWATYREGVTNEVMEGIFTALESLSAQVSSRAFVNAGRGMGKLRGWLDSHAASIVQQPPAPAAPAAPVDFTALAGGGGASAPGAAQPAHPASPADPAKMEMTIQVSHRFLELRAKLRAFEALVKKREFRKAALVADDLQQIIEHFDPRSYFPEVFASFSAHLSQNIGPLAEHWEERDSVAWKALSQYYHVDLDGFTES